MEKGSSGDLVDVSVTRRGCCQNDSEVADGEAEVVSGFGVDYHEDHDYSSQFSLRKFVRPLLHIMSAVSILFM